MKNLLPFLFVITLIAASSCVSSSKYDDLQYEYEKLESKYDDLKDDYVNKCRELEELQEEYDELEMNYLYLHDAARDACHKYRFFGATDFFTECAINNLAAQL